MSLRLVPPLVVFLTGAQVLAAADAGTDARAAACPGEPEVRRALGATGTGWWVSCHAEPSGERTMAALFDSGKRGAPLHLIVAVGGEHPVRAEIDLGGPEADQLEKIPAEEWELFLGPAKLRGVDWLRVDLVGEGGEDYAIAQEVVVFLRRGKDRLQAVWTGLGDRTEIRFDACRLESRARFSLASGGDLLRTRRSRSAFSNPGGIATDLLRSLRRDCLAAEPTRDLYPIGPGD